MSYSRELQIIKYMIEHDGVASVKQLAKELYASESSIRRDLASMSKQGLVKRNYGGARLTSEGAKNQVFSSRKGQNVVPKRAMAQKAISLIKENDILFLDQSSSSYYVAEALMTSPNCPSGTLTVVTNNLMIQNLLSNSDIKVISSGGTLSFKTRHCLLANDGCCAFQNIYANIAFFSTHALSQDGVISDNTDWDEVAIRNAMIRNAAKKVYLCDSLKFGKRSAYTQCTLRDVDVLISDVSPDGRVDLDSLNIEVL